MSQFENKAYVDRLVLSPKGKINAKELTINVSGELMKNQLPASPMEPNKNLLVVQDSKGQPMIFSIGSDHEFHLFTMDQKSATGWKDTDLLKGFKGYKAARTFDITQDIQGNISITLALGKEKTGSTDIFTAAMLSNHITGFNWVKLADHCQKIKGIDSKFEAEKIRMGTSDDKKAPLIVITGNISGPKYFYQVLTPEKPATRLEFPENVDKNPAGMMDLTLGYAFGQRGIFFLYNIGESETLECTTLATPDEGSEHYDYSPGNQKIPKKFRNLRYNCMATPTGSQTDPMFISSDIYVGTDKGIYLFRDAKAGSLQKVTDAIEDIHEIIVKEDSENISIWAMSSPNRLYYIHGKKGSQYTWDAPILFNSSVIHMAPIRSSIKKSNELFLVNQDLTISHYWQDPGSTLWRNRLIKIKEKDYLLDLNTYTTLIHLENQDGMPLAGVTLKITSSEWIYATVNGLVYSIDKDNAAEVKTDATGNVNIITLTGDISSPIFHVEADCFDKVLNIYPNGKVQKGLQSIQSGDDLKNAVTSEGKPVLTKTYNQETLEGIAGNLSKINHAGSHLIKGKKSPSNIFVTLENKGIKHTGELSFKHLPQDFALGLKLENGVWRPHTPGELTLAMPGSGLSSVAGDILHWLENAFEDGFKYIDKGVTYLENGVSFVVKKVDEGLHLVLNLADKVYSIALKTLGCLYKALGWILKLVAIELEKLLAWLGHLFGWDDIWETHKVIASIMKSGLDCAVTRADKEIDQWKEALGNTLDGIDQKIKNLIIPDQIQQTIPKSAAAKARSNHPGIHLKSPQSNWVSYHMQHGQMLKGGTTLTAGDPFSQFMKDVIEPTAKTLAKDLGKDLEDLKAVFSGSNTLGEAIKLITDMVDTVVDPVKTLLLGFLDFLKDLLGDIQQALEDEAHIPFLSTFYEWLTALLGHKEEFTFINAMALLIAVPYTIIYKAAKGHAPFSKGAQGLDDPHLIQKFLDSPRRDELTALGGTGDTIKGLYSHIGGGIGSIASFIASIAGFFSVSEEDEEGKKKKPGEMNTAGKVQLGLLLCKYACTLPLPEENQPKSAYGLKMTAYSIGALYTATYWKIPSPQLNGGVLAGVDGVILLLSTIADGLGKEDWWTWVTDWGSNVGGIIRGIAAAIEEEEVVVFGMGISFLYGSLIGAIHSFATNMKKTIQLVNVGG